MWSRENSQGYESRKCRGRVLKYLDGKGLDIGCGNEKIVKSAIGIDRSGRGADIKANAARLDIFASNSLDYVFSSHCLEDFLDTEAVLTEWCRVIKQGGYLVLYLPHKEFYPNIGQEGANPHHKRDFHPQDILSLLGKIGGWETLSCTDHDKTDEYSFQIVARKVHPTLKKAWHSCEPIPADPGQKRTLVVRYGAFGDMVIARCVLKAFKDRGDHVTLLTSDRGRELMQGDPLVDELIYQGPDWVAEADLPDMIHRLRNEYDEVVNLTHSVEGSLLAHEGSPQEDWPKELRHKRMNVNYYEHSLEIAGIQGKPISELQLTQTEYDNTALILSRHKNMFKIVWAMSGSSIHKVYPWMEVVAVEFLKKHEDVVIFTVGDENCQILEWDHPRTFKYSGRIPIRASIALAQQSDLVMGPETGVVLACGTLDVAKICMLSHSTLENLTKHWEKDWSLEPDVLCHPCHRLNNRTAPKCPRLNHPDLMDFPICMSKGHPPTVVLDQMERVYDQWKVLETISNELVASS